MSKQDRQGVRTPADLERKYDFGAFANQEQTTSKLSSQINQLNQTMAQYMASTSGTIEHFEQTVTGFEQTVTELEQTVSNLEQTVSNLEPGGGSGPGIFLVTVETDSLDTESITADKSFAEIEAAILAGQDVLVKLISNESYHIYMQMTAHLTGSEVVFCGNYNGQILTLQIQADE